MLEDICLCGIEVAKECDINMLPTNKEKQFIEHVVLKYKVHY